MQEIQWSLKKTGLLLLVLATLFVSGCELLERPEPVDPLEPFHAFSDALQRLDFEAMYQSLSAESKETYSQADFLAFYLPLYKDLGVTSANLEVRGEPEDMLRRAQAQSTFREPVNLTVATAYGPVRWSLDLTLVREANPESDTSAFHVVFHPRLVLEGYVPGDHVRQEPVPPMRGRILDRNGTPLADNGEIYQLGLVPGWLGPDRNAILLEVAETLDLPLSFIEGRLSLSWVRSDTFVDIVKLPESELPKLRALEAKSRGVLVRTLKDRVYPYKEATAHLTGTVGLIREEEYETLKDLGFPIDTKVGRSGLEALYEESLRGEYGYSLALHDAEGNQKQLLVESTAKNGVDLRLTIDLPTQRALYEALAEERAAASVMDGETGALLALVSTPSYDPNRFILGLSQSAYNALLQDPGAPLSNRFLRAYPPGAAMEPLTAAIALEAGFDPLAPVSISGQAWQADGSWGRYYVRRAIDPGIPLNLEQALRFSDNIYFAQMALLIGGDDLRQGLRAFGIGETFETGFSFDAAQVTSGEGFSSLIQLADTGYGQGEALMNLPSLSKAYSAFLHEGQRVTPTLFAGAAPMKSSPFLLASTANAMKDRLESMVQHPLGPAHALAPLSEGLGAHVGTARAPGGMDLGWMVLLSGEGSEQYVTTFMVEDVGGRGGGTLVVERARDYLSLLSLRR